MQLQLKNYFLHHPCIWLMCFLIQSKLARIVLLSFICTILHPCCKTDENVKIEVFPLHLCRLETMERLADFICTEQSTYPAVSSKIMDDRRRLLTYLKQEERFMPNNYQMRRTMDEGVRTTMLESIYEVGKLPVKVCKTYRVFNFFQLHMLAPWLQHDQ